MLQSTFSNNDIKEAIKALISRIEPFDDLESCHIQETLDWIQSGAEIFRIQKPDVPPKHLVSYFVLFDQKAQKILLVDHKNAGLWLPAGGHVDLNEHPKTAALRECQEELKVVPDLIFESPLFLTSTVTVGKTAGHVDVSLWYLFKGSAEEVYDYDKGEFESIKWYGLDEVPLERSDPNMHRFIEKLKLVI